MHGMGVRGGRLAVAVHTNGVYLGRMSSSRLKRINITVPESTLRLLDKVAPKGDRSRFITEAVHAYVARRSRARLRAELKAGAIARAARDLAIVADWSSIDSDTWPGRKR